jgi:predicted permease
MDWLLQELRVLARRMGRSPGFAAVTVLTLALGIGANTAVFAVLNSVLFKPLPFAEADRLVAVWHSAPGVNIPELNSSPSTHFTYADENRVFSGIALWRQEGNTVTNDRGGAPDPERVQSLVVTHGFFPVLQVQALRGRVFAEKDDAPGQPPTVLLTHGFWQRKYGADPGILGKKVLLDSVAYEVIGVLPESFQFMGVDASVVRPFQLDRAKVRLGNFSHQSVARLRPGVTLQQANADIARMLPMVQQKFPAPPGLSVKMFESARIGPNLRPLKDDLVGDIGSFLWVLMAAIGIVLFIACANVANLLLVRVEGRSREIAVRAALGSTRGRLAAEILLESTTLGMVGGVAGLGVAYGTLQLLHYLAPPYLPRLEEIRLDAWALAFACGLSLVAGMLLGLLPAWKNLGARLQFALRSGGRTMSEGRERHRARNTLVVVQVALAVVLLIGAGLMLRTMSALQSVQPGFREAANLAVFRLSVPESAAPNAQALANVFRQVESKLAAIPGVQSVAATSALPMDGNNSNDPLFAEGKVYAENTIPPIRRYKWVAPGYFQTMGNALAAGRDLTWTDIVEYRPVILLSENLASELFGTPQGAIGKRVRETPNSPWREVIGVVGNERSDGVHLEAPKTAYWPFIVKGMYGQDFQNQYGLNFVLRTPRAGTGALLDEIRRAVWSVNPGLPIANPRTMETIYARSMARTSFTLTMLGIASGLALLLGIIGIYGVISYSIAQRTREIGIRLALGAPEGEVSRMFLSHGLKLAAVGAAIGVAAAYPLGRLLGSLLYGVSPVDPVTYVLATLSLVAAAGLASFLPARKATRISPVEALGSD